MRYKIINKRKLIVTIILDAFGRFVFSIWKKNYNHTFDAEQINKILIIRTAYVGDVIMTLPVLKPLKEKFTEAKIDFVTAHNAAELLKGNPYIHNIYPFNPFWFYKSSLMDYLKFMRRFQKETYDLIIETRGDIRELMMIVSRLKSKIKISYAVGGGSYFLTHVVPFQNVKHRVEYHLDLVRYLGCEANKIDWNIYLQKDEIDRIDCILAENNIRGEFITVHPGSRLPLKIWLSERYAQLCNLINHFFRLPVLILGAPNEKELIDKIISDLNFIPINLVSKLSLRELAGLLSRCRLFICNDSAPMHLAAVMNAPTVAIFGPSKSQETKPYGNISRVVGKDLLCRKSCDEHHCHNGSYQACMKAISVEDVFAAVKELML